MGGANPYTGQYSMADEANVKLVRGQGLTLTAPGGESAKSQRKYRTMTDLACYSTGQALRASTFSAAEIMFPHMALGGVWEIEARVTKVPGTVFGMFTYHGDPWDAPLGWQDEQDIEILSSTVLAPSADNEAGIQLTNFDAE